jgi:hypothetical protein
MRWLKNLLLVAPVAAYAASIPLVSNLQVHPGTRLLLYRNRPFFILGLVLLTLVALLLLAPHRLVGAFRRRWHRGLILAGLLFPTYFLLVSLLKGRINLPVIGLYFVWALVSFLLAPLLFGNRREFRALIGGLLIGNLVVWLIGYYLAQTAPFITTFEDRESFGFSNPNTYAQILQVIVCLSAYVMLVHEAPARLRSLRWGLLALCVASAYFVLLAQSRNVMVFGAVALITFLQLRGRSNHRVITHLMAGAAVLGAVLVLGYFEYSELNRFSSNRLSFWARTTSVAFTEKDDPIALAFGTNRDLSKEVTGNPYSDIRDQATVTKYHADNFYLELLVEGGLIGLALFLFPYVLLVLYLSRLRQRGGERRLASLVLSLAAGFTAQGLFAATIPSFNNPIGFMFSLVIVSSVAMMINESPRAAASVVGRSGVQSHDVHGST